MSEEPIYSLKATIRLKDGHELVDAIPAWTHNPHCLDPKLRAEILAKDHARNLLWELTGAAYFTFGSTWVDVASIASVQIEILEVTP